MAVMEAMATMLTRNTQEVIASTWQLDICEMVTCSDLSSVAGLLWMAELRKLR
jgi:hypothetical protein|tara:strand:- start:744 stop:902 length:159 start_codon:yes stop_codon:yes gene_type:complete